MLHQAGEKAWWHMAVRATGTNTERICIMLAMRHSSAGFFISWHEVQNLSDEAYCRAPKKPPVKPMPTINASSPPAGIPSKNQRRGRRHNHAAKPRRSASGESIPLPFNSCGTGHKLQKRLCRCGRRSIFRCCCGRQQKSVLVSGSERAVCLSAGTSCGNPHTRSPWRRAWHGRR